ncbi:cytochrome b5-like heme/steroid binding domain-containing protein [Aspergillus desertorum]
MTAIASGVSSHAGLVLLRFIQGFLAGLVLATGGASDSDVPSINKTPVWRHVWMWACYVARLIWNYAGQWVREGAPVVMVPQSSAILRHEKEKHAISVKGDHSSMWIKEDLKNATEVFNGLYSRVQASSNKGEDRNEPSTKPRTTLPLLSVRNRVDILHSPPESYEGDIQAPEPATPSSSEYASDSDEESTCEEVAANVPDKLFFPWQIWKHNTKKGLYLIIHGKVYDVSSFIDEHPGGEEVLFDMAGEDATEAFEEIGHSDEAREILEQLLIGKVVELTHKEVATHNTKEDSFVIIHGNVYDVSSFVDEHPGGEELLLDVAGKDATEAFEDVVHSNEAREMLKGMHIGQVKRSVKRKIGGVNK